MADYSATVNLFTEKNLHSVSQLNALAQKWNHAKRHSLMWKEFVKRSAISPASAFIMLPTQMFRVKGSTKEQGFIRRLVKKKGSVAKDYSYHLCFSTLSLQDMSFPVLLCFISTHFYVQEQHDRMLLLLHPGKTVAVSCVTKSVWLRF